MVVNLSPAWVKVSKFPLFTQQCLGTRLILDEYEGGERRGFSPLFTYHHHDTGRALRYKCPYGTFGQENFIITLLCAYSSYVISNMASPTMLETTT